jgi:HrpA-like RNA helicase
VRLLEELGAITTDEQQTAYKLTPMGRQLSQLPVTRVWRAWCWKRKNTAACAKR